MTTKKARRSRPGIDNCLEENTFSLSIGVGNVLDWSFNFSQPQGQKFSPNNTIHNYALYYSTSTDPSQYFLQAYIPNNLPTCTFTHSSQFESCSVDLNNYSWQSGTQYNLYIQAVGQPGIANHMSPVAVWTP